MPSIVSSRTNGWSVRRRIERHSSYVGARLLDVDVDVAHRAHDARRLVRQPARVGVGDEHVGRLERRPHGADPRDVDVGLAAHLELEAAVALGAVAGDTPRHRLGRVLRDRAVERKSSPYRPPRSVADGQPRRLAEDVPARDVDPGLDVGMALERGVHAPVQALEVARILAEQVRGEHGRPARTPSA